MRAPDSIDSNGHGVWHHDGTTIINLREYATQLVEKYICGGCGQFRANCDCPTYNDSWKGLLEDAPENQR